MEGRISTEDRRQLLAVARQAAADALAGRKPGPIPPEGVMGLYAGAFVSFHRRGELRGCIGHPGGNQPLATVIPECSIAAATGDPRFPAVRPDELSECVIEISVLGPIAPVTDVADISVGRHGLIVEQGWHRGLLLPQVAVEYHWDREAFLSRTCGKAGLPADAWRHGARISMFEAEVFDDSGAADR